MFKKTRYKYAFRCAVIEHKSSRICFIFMLLAFLILNIERVPIIGVGITENPEFDISRIMLTNFFLFIAIIFWIVYWCAHQAERRLFPKKR